jgi:PAS domain S-box-containing protein
MYILIFDWVEDMSDRRNSDITEGSTIQRLEGRIRLLEMERENALAEVRRLQGEQRFSEDITERKQAEQAMKESELRFRSTFEQAAVGMAHAGLDGRFLQVNERFCEITGYSREELQQKTVSSITCPEDIESGESLEGQLVTGGVPRYVMERHYLRKDGAVIWVRLHVSLVRDSAGYPLYSLSVVEDISARKALEENLREREEEFRVLSEAMPQMVWASGTDGKAYYFNSRWFDYTGQTFAEAKNLGWLHALHPEDVPHAQDRWTAAVTTGNPYEAEYRIKGADGRYRWFLSRGVPKRSASTEIERWIGTCTDISEQKAVEEVLNTAREAAEDANRAKSEFLANMSHEIRTPMTVFMAVIEHLLQVDKNAERRHLLEMADVSAKRLRSVLDDMLDFSRIEAQGLELDEVVFDLRACLHEAISLFALPAREKNLLLETEIAPDVPEKVVGDPNRLGQVVVNLIGNALKFTHQGKIRVSAQTRGDFLEIAIADTGIGIPQEKHDRLFQRFSQLDSSLTRRYGGSGLGLAICKGLVELMGGEISVQSRSGEGSVFTFSVPLTISRS